MIVLFREQSNKIAGGGLKKSNDLKKIVKYLEPFYTFNGIFSTIPKKKLHVSITAQLIYFYLTLFFFD